MAFDPTAGMVRLPSLWQGLPAPDFQPTDLSAAGVVPQTQIPQAPLTPEAAQMIQSGHNFADDPSALGAMVGASARNFGSMFPILGGAAANLVKPGLGDSMVNYGLGMKRRASELLNEADVPQSLSDVHGAGDAGEWLLNSAIGMAPDLAVMAATGGVGEAAARRAAARAAEGVAQEAAERAGAKYAASKAGQNAAAKVMADTGESFGQAEEALAGVRAREVAPRMQQIAQNQAAKSTAMQAQAGRFVGTGAGLYPQVFSDMAAPQLDANGQPIPGTGLAGADRSTILKYAAGAIPAAMAGAAPEFRAFGKIGEMFSKTAPGASEAITGEAQKLLPRILKEGAVQGGLGGVSSAVSSALALGTHKWVNDNVQMLSPQALHTYMEAFGSGGILGALTGAGIETAKGGANALAGAVRSGVGAASERLGNAAGSAADLFNRNLSRVRGQQQPEEGANFVGDSQGNVSGAPIEDRDLPTDSAYPDSHERSPYGLGSTLQDLVGRFVRQDGEDPLWYYKTSDGTQVRNSVEMRQLTGAAAKLLRGTTFDDLPDADKQRITDLVPHLYKGWDTVKLLERAGQEHWQQFQDEARAENGPDDGKAAAAARLEQHLRENGELPDGYDPIEGHDDPMGALNEQTGPSKLTLSQQLDATPIDAPEHAGLQQQLRDQIYRQGGARTGRLDDQGNPTYGPLTENRSSPAAKAKWAQKNPSTHANTVEIEPTHLNNGEPRRRALQLDNLISRKLMEPENKGIGPKDALFQVLGDIHAAGHTIDPKSITPGVFYTSKDGARESLSPKEALAIRTGLQDVNTDPRSAAAQHFMERAKIKNAGAIPRLEPTERATDAVQDTRGQTSSKRDEVQGTETPDAEARKLIERKPPPGAPREVTAEGDVRGAAHGPIRDVELHPSPYEELVNRTRRLVEAGRLAEKNGDQRVRGKNEEFAHSPETLHEAERRAQAAYDKFRKYRFPDPLSTKTLREYRADTAADLRNLEDDPHSHEETIDNVRRILGDIDVELRRREEGGAPQHLEHYEAAIHRDANGAAENARAEYLASVEAKAKLRAKSAEASSPLPTTPRERARVTHEAGVQIGRAELKKEYDNGTISDKRYAAELKRLDDYSSGLSRKYVRDAMAGKYDKGKVIETPADKAEPSSSRAQLMGKMRAAARENGLDPNDLKSVANAVREFVRRGAGKLNEKQRALINAVRDLSEHLSDQHPLREAFADIKPGRGESAQEYAARTAQKKKVLIEDRDAPPAKEVANSGEGPRAHKKLTEIANALLDRLGVAEKVKVRIGGASGHGAVYSPSDGTFRLGRGLKGDERAAVFSHEIGHHVFRSELARLMSREGSKVSANDLAGHTVDELYGSWNEATQRLEGGLLGKHDPKFQEALSKDFAQWRVKHDVAGKPNVAAARIDRAAAPRAEGLASRAGGGSAKVKPADVANVRNVDEYFADHFARAMTHKAEPGTLGAFFKSVADKLKLVYDSLFTGKGGEKYAAAPSVQKWVDDLFDRTRVDVSAKLGEAVNHDQAVDAVKAAAVGDLYGNKLSGARVDVMPNRETLRPIIRFIENHLGAANRFALNKIVDRAPVRKRLYEIFGDDKYLNAEMNHSQRGMTTRMALAYLAYKGGMFDKVGGVPFDALRTVKEMLGNVAGVATEGTYARKIFDDMASGRAEQLVREQGKYEDMRSYFEKERGAKQRIFNELSDAAGSVNDVRRKLFDSVASRLERTAVPALVRVNAMIHSHTGEASKTRGYATTFVHATDLWARKYTDLVNKMSPDELREAFAHAQRTQGLESPPAHSNPAVQAHVDALNKFFADASKYMADAGVPHNVIKSYFPVVLDLDAPAKVEALRTILSDPRLRDGLYRSMGEDPKSATDAKTKELVDKQVGYAEAQSPSKAGIPDDATAYAGVFRGERHRLMQYVYDLKDPELAAKFEALQTKDPAVIMQRYVLPMVRRAESVRAFGNNDEKLNAVLAKAKQQGASDEDIQLARDAVDAARGKIGVNGSPVLKSLFGEKLAAKIANPKSRRVMQAVQVYQNVRLLPLITLSSLMDPLAIGIRTGGDLGATFHGIKEGLHAIFSKAKREELTKALQVLGSANDYFVNELNSAKFGGAGEGTARKVNDLAMKYYGIEGWTRLTRGMALTAAHRFLLDNADIQGPKAERMMRAELNLRKGDVQADPAAENRVRILSDTERAAASPIERARDDRVRNALLRVVDESIIRPNSQMAPLWMADPYMGLVSQYKTFAYAMYDHIGVRLMHELENGNYRVAAAALAYFPVIVMAEMLRGALQYGPGGNPQRKDWGLQQWGTLALDKSGFLEPNIGVFEGFKRDRQMGATPGSSLLGPTYQQLGETARFLGGSESAGRFAVHAAPAEPLLSHWIAGRKSGAGMERRT